MRYLKTYQLFESVISKAELVDKIKYYSNWLNNYMKDYNKYTTSNLNFNFSYDTALTISEIFDLCENLQHDSQDGLIRVIAFEFITWSEYFTEKKWSRYQLQGVRDFKFDYNYENYTDEFKQQFKYKLYNNDYKEIIYAWVGQEIKNLISGTTFDIPQKKQFTKEDEQFLLESITTDLEVNPNWIAGITKNGIHIKEYHGSPITSLPIKVDYDSDFIYRLNSYFGGVLILKYKIYFPFYTI